MVLHNVAGKANICADMQGLDHTLRYLSLHDNRYLRYFKGHTQQVTTLCLSPKNDLFMSAAQVSIRTPSLLCITQLQFSAMRHHAVITNKQFAHMATRHVCSAQCGLVCILS